MTKISVLIPNYNRNKLLLDTLNSVFNQTVNLDLLDIIVVDDCSEFENPEEIIALFYPRVRLVRNQRNLGQVRNLNKCIELAKCELIHILHSDDLIAPSFYESVLKAFENKDVDVVFTSSYYINDLGKIIGRNEKLSNHIGNIENILELLFVEQIIQTPSIVVKSFIYKDLGGFRDDFHMIEDWEMWIRISKKFNFWYLPEYLTFYRINTISTSSSNVYNGNFLRDLRQIQKENYFSHNDLILLNKSKEKYGNFFVSNAKKIRGFKNNLNHLLYLPSFTLRFKFILQKIRK